MDDSFTFPAQLVLKVIKQKKKRIQLNLDSLTRSVPIFLIDYIWWSKMKHWKSCWVQTKSQTEKFDCKAAMSLNLISKCLSQSYWDK